MRLLILLLLILLVPAPVLSRSGLRLGAWNLHNLFDEIDDRYADTVYTHPEVEAMLDERADVIRSLNCDVLAVEEVENRALLERLAGRLPGSWTALLVEGNDKQRGIDVGLLTRLPVRGYRTHRDDPARYSRDCLEVHLGGVLPLVVLVNHFKSKVGASRTSDAKRRRQAEGVAELARRLPGCVAVVGDLNDGPGSWPLEPLGFLRDPFGPLTLEQRSTLKHRGQPTVLDHILLNDRLWHYYVPGSAKVLRGKEVERASDHCPLRVDLAF